MPLERDGWLWGPRVGFQGIGRLLARPGEDRFCEQYFLPGNEEVHGEVSRVSRGGASWVLAKEISVRRFERIELVETKLDHVPGVSLRSLAGRARELPPAVVCGLVGKITRAFLDSPPEEVRVTPDGVWIGWDGKVRLAPFPLCMLSPHGPHVAEAHESETWTGTSTAGRNIARLLELALHGLGRAPPAVLKLLAAEPAAGTPDEAYLAALAHGLEREAGDPQWLVRELKNLFSAEELSQSSDRIIARGGHPDQLPDAIRAHVLARRDEESFAVLADHLGATGRPRGRLAMLQHQKPNGWQGAMDDLVARYPGLSPVGPSAVAPPLELEWEWGWVTRIKVNSWVAPFALHWVLDHPACIFLRELTVTALGDSCLAAIEAVADVEHSPLETLRLAECLDDASEALRARRPELKIEKVPHATFHLEIDPDRARAVTQGLRWLPGSR